MDERTGKALLYWAIVGFTLGPLLVAFALAVLERLGIDLSSKKPMLWTWLALRAIPAMIIAFAMFVVLPVYVFGSLLYLAIAEPERVPWASVFRDMLPLIGLIVLPFCLLGAVMLINRIAYWGQPNDLNRPLLPDNTAPVLRWTIVVVGVAFIIGEAWLLLMLAESVS